MIARIPIQDSRCNRPGYCILCPAGNAGCIPIGGQVVCTCHFLTLRLCIAVQHSHHFLSADCSVGSKAGITHAIGHPQLDCPGHRIGIVAPLFHICKNSFCRLHIGAARQTVEYRHTHCPVHRPFRCKPVHCHTSEQTGMAGLQNVCFCPVLINIYKRIINHHS